VAMLAMVVVLISVAAPAMAQDPKAERKAARQAAKAEKAAAKAAQPSEKMKEMPKTGGVPVNTALLGLGASAMLIGGGLLVRRVTR
jgi:LPXTG-motif cell wall-anchored protein